MTPEQAIKYEILQDAFENKDAICPGRLITEKNIDGFYEDLLVKKNLHWDYVSDFRCSGEETNIVCGGSRNYETKSVATQLRNGIWIGWIYWHGGGKHGDPGAIPWMEEAYFLECSEHEEIVIVRDFKKVNDAVTP